MPLKTQAFPALYWRMIQGNWNGPRVFRNAIQGAVVGDPVYEPNRAFFVKKHVEEHH